jgi:hypothetical protein
VISLVFFLLLVSQDQKPPELCSVSGTVTDSVSGLPLNKVLVVAEVPDSGGPLPATESDSRGGFTLINVPPGTYRLKGTRNGYLETYYGAKRGGSNGIILTLTPGEETKALQLKLIPFAVIAGTVRDPEGEALAEAPVALISLTYRNGVRVARSTGQFASTDDLGQFRIPNVKPGRYFVRAAKERPGQSRPIVNHSPKDLPPPQVLVPTFHPSARDISGARAIEIGAGDRLTGADITLGRSRLYRVSVTLEGPPGMEMGVGLDERPNLGDGLSPQPSSDCKAQVCEFPAVPSGLYSATGEAGASNRTMTMMELFSNNGRFRASSPVDVIDADVTGVRVTIGPGTEIAGHIGVKDDDKFDLSEAAVTFVDAEGTEHNASASKEGVFTALLQQGRYEVQAHARRELIAESIRAGDIDIPAEGLTISRPGKISMEVVLSRNGAAVEGVVQDKDDQPVQGAIVVLIPESSMRSRHDRYQETTTDQHGRYHFIAIPPGDYKLFVWSEIEEGIWFDPEFLKDAESGGHSITLQAKAHETASLRLLPSGK